MTLLRRILSDSNPNFLDQGTYLIRFAGKQISQLAWDPPSHLLGIATAQVRREALPQGGYSNPPHVRWAPREILQANSFHKDVVHEMPDHEASRVASKEYEFALKLMHGDEAVRQTYCYIYGDPRSAAIYRNAIGNQEIQPGHTIRSPTFQDLLWCLEFDMFSIESVVSFLDMTRSDGNSKSLMMMPEGPALGALGTAHRIYQSLPTATVSTRALNYPLNFPRWAKEPHKSSEVGAHDPHGFDTFGNKGPDHQISQAEAFSCVAWLEAGVDLTFDLENVIAVAYEDSIYVSMNLTCDPWEAPSSHELKCVVGNVGKPGLTLLIPSDDPVVPELEESSWRLIGTFEFNGLAKDSFLHTSMHLSFTEYYFPFVRASDRQGQDKLVNYLESVISIHHAGQWLGYVDLQKCLASTLLTREPSRSYEQLHGTYSADSGVRSVESWEDVINAPPGDGVIRAHGNWVARLATTAVSIHLLEAGKVGLKEIVVFPLDYCCRCDLGWHKA